MPLPKKLSFKSGAKYTVGQAFSDSYTSTEREQLRQLLVSPDIFVSRSAAFSVKYLDLYYRDEIRATEGDIVGTTPRWTFGRPSSTLQRGALQRGAALACTTTLMGATISPRRVHSYRSRYFDFTSTTRPDESFTKYAPHCRQKSPGTLLTMSTTTQPTKRSATSSVWTHSRGTATGEQPGDTMAGQLAWLYMDRFGVHPQSYLKQSVDANSGFVDFMLDQTQGFTLAGVERLNDSIRTYVLAILGRRTKNEHKF